MLTALLNPDQSTATVPTATSQASAITVCVLMPLAEQRGGGELMLWHLLKERGTPGVNWVVIFLEHGPLVEQLRGVGIDVRVVVSGRLRQPVRALSCVRRIAAIARECGAGLIFSWMPKAHMYGSLAAVMTGVPSGWYQLGVPSDGNWLDKAATALPARGVLTLSRAGLKAQAGQRPSRPVRLVYPAAELDRFDADALPSPADMRRKLGLPAGGPIIGIVGRLQRWKGFHVLVAAMPRILQIYPDAHCVLVGGEHDGEPGYPRVLRSQIESLGLNTRVVMTGLQRNIPEWMQAMDVFVHASDHEPFGIVIIEAMALGKPVVAADAAGPAEIITPGVDGLLTPFGDPDAMAEAILRYLGDPDFSRRIGAAARVRAQAFSVRRFSTEVADALRTLVCAPHRFPTLLGDVPAPSGISAQ